MKVLQANLNHCRVAQDLLAQEVISREVDVVLVAEPYDLRQSSAWLVDEDGVAGLIATQRPGNYKAVSALERGHGWVAASVDGVTFYSVYFSPNRPLAEFETFLDDIGCSIRRKLGAVVIGGDLNAKSGVWGGVRTDCRGDVLLEWTEGLGLGFANQGSEFTCVRGCAGSVVDVTIGNDPALRKVNSWRVDTSTDTLSDHRYVEFVLEIDRRKGRHTGGNRRWAVNRLKTGVLEALIEARCWLQCEGPRISAEEAQWDGVGRQSNLTATRAADQLIKETVKACEASMPCQKINRKTSVYWWNDAIAAKKKECNRLRRRATRRFRASRIHEAEEAKAELEHVRGELKNSIMKAKAQCLTDLRQLVDSDPWGRPYKLVMGKLNQPPPPLMTLDPATVETIAAGLFPQHQVLEDHERQVPQGWDPPGEITNEELGSIMRRIKGKRKSPGLDGIPSRVWEIIHTRDPDGLREVLNRCLQEGVFPSRWKAARLVLLRKGSKPEGLPSSYRPLCLLDEAGKILERVIGSRVTEHVEERGGLSDNQFGFRAGRSTNDAVLHMKRRVQTVCDDGRLCVAVSLDVKNAFNSLPWKRAMEALREWEVPAYLVCILSSYFQDRLLVYETRAGRKTRRMTAGVPQGSVLGPLMWNIAFDGLLRVPLPPGCQTLCFADDTLLLVEGRSLEEVRDRSNQCIQVVTDWMNNSGLAVGPTKTEAVLFRRRRKRATPEEFNLTVQGIPVPLTPRMTYLGLTVDEKWSFVDHFKETASKAEIILNQLLRLLPNVRGPSESKRRLYANVVHSVLLYGAPTWAGEAERRTPRTVLGRIQRKVALRTICAYRTASYDAVLLLARTPPMQLLAWERAEVFRRKVEQRRDKEVTIGRREIRQEVVRKWRAQLEASSSGRWTWELVGPWMEGWLSREHGELTFHMTQLLTGHGCFASYLFKIGKALSPACPHCRTELEDARHTLIHCPAWSAQRRGMERTLGVEVDSGNLVAEMLSSAEKWEAVSLFATAVMLSKEEEERERERQGRTL